MSLDLASLRELFTHVASRVTVVEVSARDGLQAEEQVLTPEARAGWIRTLLATGLPEAEAGSFVDPRRVPQMAGTDRVLAELSEYAERLWVLVPNSRGLRMAAQAGARNVVCLVSATETHSRANLGRSIDRVLDDLRDMGEQARSLGLQTRVAISMAWVDPHEGEVPPERVADIAKRLRDAGFPEITLCDTYGGASPGAVAALLERLRDIYPVPRIGLHLHDTFGVGSANVLVGLLAGVSRFDGAIGGLGGCPFAPGARGNAATEQLVYLLHSLGVSTGVDLRALREASTACLELLRTPRPPS